MLEHGRPMIFGAESNKGLRMNGTRIEVVELGNGITEADLLVHDETDRGLAFLLTELAYPEFPEPLGVIYASDDHQTYERVVEEQVRATIEARGPGDLEALINEGETWVVDGE